MPAEHLSFETGQLIPEEEIAAREVAARVAAEKARAEDEARAAAAAAHREYVRNLEATLNEAYALIEKETVATSGRWHGNEARLRLLERIENLLHK